MDKSSFQGAGESQLSSLSESHPSISSEHTGICLGVRPSRFTMEIQSLVFLKTSDIISFDPPNKRGKGIILSPSCREENWLNTLSRATGRSRARFQTWVWQRLHLLCRTALKVLSRNENSFSQGPGHL